MIFNALNVKRAGFLGTGIVNIISSVQKSGTELVSGFTGIIVSLNMKRSGF